MEMVYVVISFLVVLLVLGLTFYRKKTGVTTNDVNIFTTMAVNILTSYLEKNAKEDIKNFDDISEYLVFIKDYILDILRTSLTLETKQPMDAAIERVLNSNYFDDLLVEIIHDNSEKIQETFDSIHDKAK